MARKKVFDSAKLIKAVESGLPAKETMSKFGFKTRTQLKSFYLDALVETGKVKGIVTASPRKLGDKRRSRQLRLISGEV